MNVRAAVGVAALLFFFATGAMADGSLANLHYNGGYLCAQLGNTPPFQECVTIQSVPEPGTLVLLCAGKQLT